MSTSWPAAPEAYGKVRPEALLAARIERTRLDGILWDEADSTRVVNDASSEQIFVQKGATQELTPLNLDNEPEVGAVLAPIGFDDLI